MRQAALWPLPQAERRGPVIWCDRHGLAMGQVASVVSQFKPREPAGQFTRTSEQVEQVCCFHCGEAAREAADKRGGPDPGGTKALGGAQNEPDWRIARKETPRHCSAMPGRMRQDGQRLRGD